MFGFKNKPPIGVFYKPDHFDSKIKLAALEKKYNGDL
jgi:hypothetical protein